MRPNILLVIFVMLALALGFLIPQYPPNIVIGATAALAVFIITFINVDWGLYILIFSMLLSPEINIGETGGTSLQRGITLRFEDFLLVLIGFSWLAKNAVNKELGLFLKTPLNRPIIIYIVVCFVSTGLGILSETVSAKTGLLYVIKYIEYFIVFFMVVNHVKRAAQIKRFAFCLFLTCFIISIFGILQIPGGERVTAPFEGEVGEPNTLGGYLVFIFAIAAGLFIETDNSRWKSLLPVLIATIIPPLLFTQSRSSYLALLATCFILGLLHKRRIIITGLMVVAFAISPFFLPSSVKDRILFTFTQEKHSEQVEIGEIRLDTSTSERIVGLKNLIQNFPKHPVLGYGITGYQFIDSQYPKVLIETGTIGFLAFCYLLYSIFKIAIFNLKELKLRNYKGLSIGFIAGYVGLLFHALGTNTFIIVRIMEPFWFFAGIIAVLPAVEQQHQQLPETKSSPVRRKLAAVR